MIILDIDMPESCKDCRINTDGNGRCGLINSSCMYFAGHNTKPVYCPIKNEIPNDATNGDVIKALFPNTKNRLDENTDIMIVKWDDGISRFYSHQWWDSPWKGQERA